MITLGIRPIHHGGDGQAQGGGVTRGGVGGGQGHRAERRILLALPAQSIVYLLGMNAARGQARAPEPNPASPVPARPAPRGRMHVPALPDDR